MAGVEEEYRRRVAFTLILVGFGLILTGAAVVILHHFRIETDRLNFDQHADGKALSFALIVRQVLFLLVVIVIIFSVAIIAFLRWSRGFRRMILRRPNPPTPAEDVWEMHRLPEEFKDDDASDSGDAQG